MTDHGDPGKMPGKKTIDHAEQLAITERRLRRAEAGRREAEALLEHHSRALARSNRDLTEREHELIARLERGNRHLLRAQDTAKIASFHIDRGEQPFLSPQFFAIIGLPASTPFTPEDFIQYIHPLDRTRMVEAGAAFFASDHADVDHRFEHRLVRADGALRWVRWIIRRERGADGRFESVFGTIQDITEPRATRRQATALGLVADRRLRQVSRLAEALRLANAEAERAHRAHGRFLAMMSHDIRTPLNGLLGMLDLLAAAELAPADRRKVEIMRTSGDQLRLLVSDIIDIADMGADELTLDPVPLHLPSLLAQIAENWRSRRPAQALWWTVDATVPPAIMLDARRLRQLLEGLLGAMIDGDVSIRTHALGNWLRFDITGGGTPSDLTAESSGIIGQRIVDAMQGRLGGDKLGGDKADLWFELPIDLPPENWSEGHSAGLQAGSIMLSIRGRSPHILVAEDIETNRIVICSILEGLGCTYATVADGEAAVAAVAGGKFDAVLMDVMMPIMDGAEATERIRSLTGGMANVPIIGVTAHSLQLERDALLSRGMNACLTKPVDRDAIHATLAPLLDWMMDSGSAIDSDVFEAAFAPLPPHRRQALLDLALDDVRQLGDELAAASGTSDADAINRARAAHSLKGVAGNFGFTAITTALAEMAATGRQTRLPGAVADVMTEARLLFLQRGLMNP